MEKAKVYFSKNLSPENVLKKMEIKIICIQNFGNLLLMN